MRRLTPALVAVLAILVAPPIARAGTLRTRDGQTLEGDLRFDSTGAVTVTPRAAGALALTYKLSDVAALTLRPPLSGVQSGGKLAGEWAVQDVGAVGLVGSADYSMGEFTLRGEGAQFGARTDAFHFISQRLPTDGSLIAHVKGLADSDAADAPNLLPGGAMAGLMIRHGLNPEGMCCAIALTAGEGAKLYSRVSGDVDAVVTPAPAGRTARGPWLKLVRYHGNVSCSVGATSKGPWTFVGGLPMAGIPDANVGLFVTSGRANQLVTATFDQVRLQIHGVRGEYFGDTELKELRLARVDPDVNFTWGTEPPASALPASNYSVRWTGQVEAPATDTYTFAMSSTAMARMWLNGRRITPQANAVNLTEGKRYELKVEFAQGNGGFASCKLMWGSKAEPALKPIPTDVLYYVPDPVSPAPAGVADNARGRAASRGIMLADGSFLAGTPKSADAAAVVFSYKDQRDLSIPVDQVAWVIFRPLSGAAVAKVPARGAGLLTTVGDYVEGEPRGIADGKATLNSVVFGVSTFDTAAQTAAVIYRDPGPSAAPWVVHTTNGSAIRAASLKSTTPGTLVIDEPLLGPIEVRLGEVTEIAAADEAR